MKIISKFLKNNLYKPELFKKYSILLEKYVDHSNFVI